MVIKKIITASIIIAIALAFIAGSALGWLYGTKSLSNAVTELRDSEISTESLLIEQEILDSLGIPSCDAAEKRLEELFLQLGGIGRTLADKNAEAKLGSEFKFLKTKYHLLQLRTYGFNKKIMENCGERKPIILFYYSANNESIEQGKALDEIAKNLNANILAVEKGYSDELAFAESYYSINETPTLIINYKTVFRKFSNYERIRNAIGDGR